MSAKAVIVGCATYDLPGISSLKFPETDARELCRRLVDAAIGGYAESDVSLLTSPSYGEASLSLGRVFRSASPQDSVLVYFAGHGLRDDEGNIYLAVRDTNPELLEVTSIASRLFRQLMDACRSRKICVILDCCFSGAFASRSVPSVADVGQSVTALTGEGTIILTATQRTQEARERDDFGHGVFTNYLLQGIDGAADTDGDGIITALDLYSFIARKMEDLGVSQRPMFSGSVAGGVFPLVRSGRRRAAAISALRQDIETLCRDNRHLEAASLLEGFTAGDPAEAAQLAALGQEIENGKRSLREAFRGGLLRAAEQRALSDQTLREVLDILAKRPDGIFEAKPTDARSRLLRTHFLGRLDAATLEEMWSPAEGAGGLELPPSVAVPPPTPPPSPPLPPVNPDSRVAGPEGSSEAPSDATKGVSRPVRMLTWVAAALAIVTAGYFFTPARVIDPGHLRLGLLLKMEWKGPTAETVFSAILRQLNARLQSAAGFDTAVTTFTNIKEVSEALKAGSVDVVGELSPRDIYAVQDIATPFVTGLYGGQQHYNALIFVPGDSPYLDPQDGLNEVKERSWIKLLTAFYKGEGKLAVTDDSSTSGYWFPRGLVLEEFRQRQWFRGFADLTVESRSQELLNSSVACNTQKVIAGVIAAFRFQAGVPVPCQGRPVKLVSVQKTEGILQGAYVVRTEVAKNESVVRALKNSWANAVAGLSSDQRLALNLPTEWESVNPTYYDPMRQVFTVPDPVEDKQLRDQRLALTAAALILLACAGAYYALSLRGSARQTRDM